MTVLNQDVTHAIRMFRKSPAFTITAVAALALGIGATTAIFSIVNTVLLKPLPVPAADRFVMLISTDVTETGQSDSSTAASPAKFAFWRSQGDVIQDVSAFLTGVVNYSSGDVVEQWRSMSASVDTFRCWGIPILQGRGFTPDEDLPNGPRVALISQNLWVRRFASNPRILGQAITLSGALYTVIGVAADNPALREFGPALDVYVPFQLDPDSSDQGDYFDVVARLKPGVTVRQAQARVRTSASAFRSKFPKALGPKEGFTVVPFREAVVGDVPRSLLILLGAVGMVLLIACANVANLLLVRAAGRRREIGIRLAIGAGRGRVIRQLLTESMLLSLAGGALGLLLGYGGIRALLAVNTADLPLVGQNGTAVAMDWRVMGFAVVVSLLVGVAFGLFPAFQGSRVDLNSILKESSGRTGTGLRQNKTRAVLVMSEVSLAVVLLVGSALLIRSFVALYAVERGFDTSHVVTMRMSMSGPRYLKSMAMTAAVRDGLEHIRSLPGVVAASATCCIPLQGNYDLGFEIIGRRPAEGATQEVGWAMVSPGYFEVFKIPVKRGRPFTNSDDSKSPAVAVINESMARKYWKNGDPLKDRIAIGRGLMKAFKDEPVRQIVGIVGDVRDEGLASKPRPALYVPQAQMPDASNAMFGKLAPMAWVVRTQGEPQGLIPAIQKELRKTTSLPVSEVRSMDEVVSLSTGRQRFNMLLMTVFGGSALLLAAIGIYGLMAYSVEQRRQEIGIRLALGAQTGQVRNIVVRQGMSLALAGVVVGVGAAWGLARLIESFLFGVKAQDPLVFAAVPLVLCAVALLAVWLPANRASRVSPVESLRYE